MDSPFHIFLGKYLITIYYEPGILPSVKDTEVKETDKIPALMKLILWSNREGEAK